MWIFIDKIWKIFLTPVVALYFLFIPLLNNFDHYYFKIYSFSFVAGFLFRLPRFIKKMLSEKSEV